MQVQGFKSTVDSKMTEYGFGVILSWVSLPSVVPGSEDGHIPAFWLLL